MPGMRVTFDAAKANYRVRLKSQFPAAATLELLVGFRLGCSTSTVRTLHRANLGHNAVAFSLYPLTLLNRENLTVACWRWPFMHF